MEPKPEPATDGGLGQYRGMIDTDKTAAELIEEARDKDREREERLKKVARGELDENGTDK